jgi:ABC-type nitrate/sulfonate/bicarbonate transport system permease component
MPTELVAGDSGIGALINAASTLQRAPLLFVGRDTVGVIR